MSARDALMVTGFDILGQNRTLQIHWGKRIVAFVIDCLVVLGPVWVALLFLGERRIASYGIVSGVAFFFYATIAEALWRKTVGKAIAGLEVRPVAGPVVEGDPRQRFSDRILGTTVAQSSLIHVRLQRIGAAQ